METEASLQATNTVELSRKRGGKERSRKARRKPPPEFGSPEDVNLRDVFALLGEASISSLESEGECDAPLELYSEVELTVLDIGSNGGRLFRSSTLLHTASHSHAFVIRGVDIIVA